MWKDVLSVVCRELVNAVCLAQKTKNRADWGNGRAITYLILPFLAYVLIPCRWRRDQLRHLIGSLGVNLHPSFRVPNPHSLTRAYLKSV